MIDPGAGTGYGVSTTIRVPDTAFGVVVSLICTAEPAGIYSPTS